MKKLFLLAGIVIIIASCERMLTVVPAINTNKGLVAITLNGIDSLTASSMKTNFKNLKDQDIRPLHQSVWFDSATFHHIVSLLLKERGTDNSTLTGSNIGQTDGMRIYFASSAAMKNNHLQSSVVLVSTKNIGEDQSGQHYSVHADYYKHDPSDPLFANPALIKGQVETQIGIKLSDKELNQSVSQASSPNPHYISKRAAYEMQNYYGTAPVTTISEWFDIKILVALDQGKHDGVRIYFARHKALNVDGSADIDALKEAFILVPTIRSGNSHIDRFIANTDAGIGGLSSGKIGTIRILADSGAFENGEECPNNCDISN